MKTKRIITYFFATVLLASCSSDIEFTDPVNMTGAIQFSVGSVASPTSSDASMARTRADHTHIDWNPEIHASTLGVFGFADGYDSKKIFDNQKIQYNTTTQTWTTQKYWGEYSDKTSFDFFGYMMEADNLPSATLTKSGNAYTLSFSASIISPILTSPDKTPLICHSPTHCSKSTSVVFQMDQTLTGYSVWFKLGDNMDNVRDFTIKSVKIYGNNLPISGTVNRTYTLNDGTWTAGEVSWNVTGTQSVAETPAVSIPISLEPKQVTVNTHTDWVKWGGSGITDGAFFAIPSADFTPTIEVTYDVVANDDNNGDGSIITRKDVKSTIILNSDNFKDLTAGTPGIIHPIKIKIVPKYLYVLSDDDQSTGFLVVEKQAQQ